MVTISINDSQHYDIRHKNTQYRVTLNADMLRITFYIVMPSIAFFYVMLSVIILGVVILGVEAPAPGIPIIV